MIENIEKIDNNTIIYKGEVLNVPHHIAVIPDGNRRWAKERGLPAVAGHKEGVETYKLLLENAADLGISYVTFYAFSTENWKRSKAEVEGLMSLLALQLKNFDNILGKNKNKICFKVIGNRSELSSSLQKAIQKMEEKTKDNKDLTAIIAINYGGRDEIVNAVKQILTEFDNTKISQDLIDENKFNDYLYTSDIPDPDLLIRTSGEERISNFLLWQLAYTEFYFDNCFWPDFKSENLIEAVRDFSKRQRRYGGA
jgi:undecaprenyl diphosphate synthase